MSKLIQKYNPNLAHFIILIGLSIIIPSGFYFLEGLLISLLFLTVGNSQETKEVKNSIGEKNELFNVLKSDPKIKQGK